MVRGGERVALPGKRERVLLAYLALSPKGRQPRKKLATLLGAMPPTRPQLTICATVYGTCARLLGIRNFASLLPRAKTLCSTLRLSKSMHWNFADSRRNRVGADWKLRRPCTPLNCWTGSISRVRNSKSWRRTEASRFKDQALDVLSRLLTQLSEASETERAIEAGSRILRLEPLHEPAVRRLMRLYAASGRRGPAIQLYRALTDALKTGSMPRPTPRPARFSLKFLAAATRFPAPRAGGADEKSAASTIGALRELLPAQHVAPSIGAAQKRVPQKETTHTLGWSLPAVSPPPWYFFCFTSLHPRPGREPNHNKPELRLPKWLPSPRPVRLRLLFCPLSTCPATRAKSTFRTA